MDDSLAWSCDSGSPERQMYDDLELEDAMLHEQLAQAEQADGEIEEYDGSEDDRFQRRLWMEFDPAQSGRYKHELTENEKGNTVSDLTCQPSPVFDAASDSDW